MVFDPARPDAVGRATGGAIRIADPDGRPLPAGAIGEVWLRAPHHRAYVRDDDANRATFRAGWVRMGDLGRLDAEGYLYLADRDSDLVSSGAFKASTLEVEAALYEHPHVAEAAVLGVPHPVLGAAIAAAVVPRAHASPADVALPALRRFLAGRLADYQLPSRALTLDRLPRNDAGKVLKRHLMTRFEREAT
jgi:long-chain acyl-CoA synthetase